MQMIVPIVLASACVGIATVAGAQVFGERLGADASTVCYRDDGRIVCRSRYTTRDRAGRFCLKGEDGYPVCFTGPEWRTRYSPELEEQQKHLQEELKRRAEEARKRSERWQEELKKRDEQARKRFEERTYRGEFR